MGETVGSSWKDHKLLHCQAVTSVLPSVDYIEGGSGQHVLRLVLQIGEGLYVLIEGDVAGSSSSSSHSQGHREDSIGSKLVLAKAELVGCAVELLDHEVVDVGLSDWVPSLQGRRDDVGDVADCLGHSLPHVLVLLAVPQLQRLILACGCSRRHSSSKDA